MSNRLKARCILVSDAAECEEYVATPTQSTLLQLPDDPIIPIVRLTAPQAVGLCADVELNAIASEGKSY